MQMAERSEKLANETISYVKEMNGQDKTDFIDLIFSQYKASRRMKYPKREVLKFYDLLSKLVKTFGH
tara:strand:- start:668 stop:868 length:201 start_codon:yes stop_codon:yes gene_type:complete